MPFNSMSTSGQTFSFYEHDIYHPMVSASPKPNVKKFESLFSTAIPEPNDLNSKRSFTDRNKSLDLPSVHRGGSSVLASSMRFNPYTKKSGSVFKKLVYIEHGPQGRQQKPTKDIYSKER